MLKFELPRNQSSIIKVIGVGGGGSNAVNHMYQQGIKGVDFIVCNTDAQALDKSPVPNKIQLGLKGLGAGSIPSVGKESAVEKIDEIRKLLEVNTSMVFITAGMGGGTGTGAAPVIASVAKELGILTVGIVTIPFLFEGRKRAQQAQDGIDELKKYVDTLLIICNDKLRELEGDLKISAAFSMADDILTTAAKGIAEIITVPGYINVDFEDVRTVMKNSGKAIMGTGVAEGENRALEAVRRAMRSPLLDDNNISGAENILLYIMSGEEEISLDEVMEITDFIQNEAGSTAEIIWGNGTDESLGNKIAITVVATGFDSAKNKLKAEIDKNKIVHPLHNEKLPEVAEPEAKKEPTAELNEIQFIDRSINEYSVQPVIQETSPTESQAPSLIFEFEISPPTFENYSNDPSVPGMPTTISRVEETQAINMPISSVKTPEVKQPSTENPERSLAGGSDRIKKLREFSEMVRTPEGLQHLEKQPAYLRRNVELSDFSPSSDTEVSRYTLTKDGNDNVEVRQNNSFLHDNVD
ncbi:MAG TPA: cell division protein FtsZ [Bacteroidales bacterium]